MVIGVVASAQACRAGPSPRPDPLFPPLRAGNNLGEEGCEQLQEVLDGFNMAKVLASLRWGIWISGSFVTTFIHSVNVG